jgi:hypothetical protein
MSYVYMRSEPGLWTVGFYQPDDTWEPESDHRSSEEAAQRVAWLNGGRVNELRDKVDRLEILAAVTGRGLEQLNARLGFGTDAEGDPIAVEPCPCSEQRAAAEAAWAAKVIP